MKKSGLILAIKILCIATSLAFVAGAVLITVIGLTSYPTLFTEMLGSVTTLFTLQPIFNNIVLTYVAIGVVGLLLLLDIVFFIVILVRRRAPALWGLLSYTLAIIAFFAMLMVVMGPTFTSYAEANFVMVLITTIVLALAVLFGVISFVFALIATFMKLEKVAKKEKTEAVPVTTEVVAPTNDDEVAVPTDVNPEEVEAPKEEEPVEEITPTTEVVTPKEEKAPVSQQPRVVIVPDESREIVINIVTNPTPTQKVVKKVVVPVKKEEVKVVEPVEEEKKVEPVKEENKQPEPIRVVKRVVKKVYVTKEKEPEDNSKPKPIPPTNRKKAATVKIKRIKQDKPAAVTTKPVKGDFKERILAQTKDIQKLYNSLKSYIFQYAVKSRLEDENEVIYHGDETYMLIAVLGTKLKVYYALNPQPYLKTTHPAVDASKHQKYAATPTEFSIKDERDLKRAQELIEDLMVNKGRRKGKLVPTNWVKELK